MDFKGFPGLAGKTAIVTGSTQGLGADIARGLAAAGANVVLVGRNAPAGQALADELRERALYCETDIGQDAQIERCIQAALATFGRIDILVNNACQYADQGLASSREQWHATLDTNLVSAAIFTQLVAPRLPRGGVVVNMGSTGGKFGAAGRAIYPASKAALLQITKNFAVELAPAGVRVLAVSPAWTGRLRSNNWRAVRARRPTPWARISIRSGGWDRARRSRRRCVSRARTRRRG